MIALKSATEMDRIRKAEAVLREKQIKEFVPEKIEYRDEVVLIISRCDKGPQGWKGLFKVSQVPIDDKTRLALFKLPRKQLKEGVDPESVTMEMSRALARKCFR